MRLKLGGSTHATVVAYLALFVALGGSAVAASGVLVKRQSQVGTGVITSRALKNNKAVKVQDLTPAARSALAGAKGDTGLAGAPGPAGPTGPAGPSTGRAGGALTGTYPNPLLAPGAVDSAAFAASATAPNADKLDGKDSTDFLAAPGEGWHFVGAAGEPSFPTASGAPNLDGACAGGANSWANYGDGYTRAAFFRDSMGMVHLSGLVKGGQLKCAIFQLPLGYRPEERTIVPVLVSPDVVGRLDIAQGGLGGVSGVVVPRATGGNNTYVSLAGISFPCGPSGANGCP